MRAASLETAQFRRPACRPASGPPARLIRPSCSVFHGRLLDPAARRPRLAGAGRAFRRAGRSTPRGRRRSWRWCVRNGRSACRPGSLASNGRAALTCLVPRLTIGSTAITRPGSIRKSPLRRNWALTKLGTWDLRAFRGRCRGRRSFRRPKAHDRGRRSPFRRPLRSSAACAPSARWPAPARRW